MGVVRATSACGLTATEYLSQMLMPVMDIFCFSQSQSGPFLIQDLSPGLKQE